MAARDPNTAQDEHDKPDGAKLKPVAVALHYQHGTDPAPRIVASGRGKVAERILELAFEHGIKVRQDADLAETLSAVEIGSEIPIAAFAAVAEILFYIYKANRALPPASAATRPFP